MNTRIKRKRKSEAIEDRKVLAVYGTLRKDMGFFNRLSDAKYIRTTSLQGYKLWIYRQLPFITPTRQDFSITVDILNLSEKEFNAIRMVEEGAGYKLICTENQPIIDNNAYPLYIADPRVYSTSDFLEKGEFVRSGDYKLRNAVT